MNFFSLIFTILILNTGEASVWEKNGMNDPSFFNLTTQKFQRLPKTGFSKNRVLSSSHWLHKNGGISFRWQTNLKQYEFLKRKDLQNGFPIKDLSPAEKYDLLRGDYNFSLARQERISSVNYKYEWEGHCHGWVSAGLKYSIPTEPVTLKNKDGIEILFYPQDIMAILSYFEGVRQTPWDFWVVEHKLPWLLENVKFEKNLARIVSIINSIQDKDLREDVLRKYSQSTNKKVFQEYLLEFVSKFNLSFYSPYVGVKNNKDIPESNDLNPGALHLVLANSLGLKRRGVVADTDILSPVWNRPIVGYETTILDDYRGGRSIGQNLRRLKIETVIHVVKERTFSQNSKDKKDLINMKLKYFLDLNQNGDIIGGEWLKGSEKVDFIWSPYFSTIEISDVYYNSELISALLGKKKVN